MAGGGGGGVHQRSFANASFGSDVAAVSISGIGFHSDNGSEFINHTVAILLNKLWWNRLNHGRDTPMTINDNWLVEAKNGAVIRKHMGYGHIASSHAEAIEKFYE